MFLRLKELRANLKIIKKIRCVWRFNFSLPKKKEWKDTKMFTYNSKNRNASSQHDEFQLASRSIAI